jgi:hypothetical protein
VADRDRIERLLRRGLATAKATGVPVNSVAIVKSNSAGVLAETDLQPEVEPFAQIDQFLEDVAAEQDRRISCTVYLKDPQGRALARLPFRLAPFEDEDEEAGSARETIRLLAKMVKEDHQMILNSTRDITAGFAASQNILLSTLDKMDARMERLERRTLDAEGRSDELLEKLEESSATALEAAQAAKAPRMSPRDRLGHLILKHVEKKFALAEGEATEDAESEADADPVPEATAEDTGGPH